MGFNDLMTSLANTIRTKAYLSASQPLSVASMITVVQNIETVNEHLVGEYIARNIVSTVITSDISRIGNYAFAGNANLTSVSIPSNIGLIGKAAFRECGALPVVTIPDTVSAIGELAFAYCPALSSAYLGSGLCINSGGAYVNTIGSSAFGSCPALECISCNFSSGTVPGAPWGAPKTCMVYYKNENSEN